jgi:uncharacterized protein (TIGR02680 family)
MTSIDEAWLAPETAHDEALPRPTTDRWQPLRLGLVDLFYYDDEQFWFHDGRLLLRGNNGTGKSKVLALSLPFLLDGSVLARRVEPDADPKKRMEWNLLLGGAHPHSERTGYSWVEFGRVDGDGVEHFTTLGIGLKAAAGRGIVKTWYFTTSRRVGDLRLLDATRTVLGPDRLREELAGTGQVHPTQDSYRRAVDEALFHLGEERYGALIDLLIQLRQPQLSKRPDEKALSAALTEALAPLDQAVVADVAESFRSLQEERDAIAATKDTLGAAQAFLRHYRGYAQVAARRRTTAVRTANSHYEHAGRELTRAETELAEAGAEVQRLEAAQQEAARQEGVLTGQERALRESPEMRDAKQLEQAVAAADDMAKRAHAADDALAHARTRAEREAQAEAAAADRHLRATADADRREAAAVELIEAAGLAAEHPQIRGDEQAARRALARRREQLDLVRQLARAADDAAHDAGRLRGLLDTAETTEAGRAEDVRTATVALDTATDAYGARIAAFLADLSVLTFDRRSDELTEAAREWARHLDGLSPVRVAVDSATDASKQTLARRHATAEQTADALAAQLADLAARISELEAGRDPEPPAAPGRDPRARVDVAGAPLWQVVDFAAHLPEADRAGIEAALQSAGLLDAWLFPDGTLQATGDVVLGPSGPAPSREALSLVLVPSIGPDTQLADTVVAAVLSRIGLGEDSGAALWVDRDGRWSAGPARGSWSKQRAEYVGAGAREAHRQTVLTALRHDVADLEQQRQAVLAEIAEVQRLVGLVTAEHAAYPVAVERELATAHERVAASERELGRAQAAVTEARASWEQAEQRAAVSAGELADAAADLGVGGSIEQLDAAVAAVGAYGEALVEVRRALQAAAEAEGGWQTARARAEEAGRDVAAADASARELGNRAATLRARADVLQDSVGASVAELQARLAEITTALEQVTTQRQQLQTEQMAAVAQRARLDERTRDLGVRRDETALARTDTIDALRTFAATGLLRLALPELATPDPRAVDEWNVTAALVLSRTGEQQLSGIDESDDGWSRAQQRVSSAQTELAAQMSRHGHTAWVEQHGDVLVARVRYLTDEVDVDQLADRLSADVEERERLLSAREREILENHLVNEVAGHLHELLMHAEGQIGQMNAELARRKTSTGMQLRVRWHSRADGPAGLAAARTLMLRSDATWTPEDRAAISDFLQAQIAEIRDADPAGSWQEHLEQALDYRRWHTFAVDRWQNGRWRPASGPASGGEKVLAVSVPLFAAAAAHYNSAGPLAPRLILLDEAFAGVDDDSRAKSLGLLATFDLDVVMTSEREWGCYPQVPGLSIAQLSRVEGVDAVGVTRWRWDGRRRERLGEVGDTARAGGPESPSEPPPGESLFG